MIFDGDRDLLRDYLGYLASMVGLHEWKILLSNDPPDSPKLNGQCDLVYGRNVAAIRIRVDWFDMDEDDLRQTLTHELLHCHTEKIIQPLQDIEDTIGKMIHAPLYNATRNGLEHAIDAMATHWGGVLLLPDAWFEASTAPEGSV